jgi:hypothetical protein
VSVLTIGLGIVGMPENEIADVQTGLPVLSSILDEAKELEPILEQMRPHIVALIPMVKQAMPIASKMWPQIVAETPLLQELVAFIRSKS